MTSRSLLPSESPPRVVITGIGLWTPLGADRESTWCGLVAGRSATRWLSPPHWTGQMPMAGAPRATSNADDRVMQFRDPLLTLAHRTADEAVRDANLSKHHLASERTGVVFGTSKGGLHTASRLVEAARSNGNNSSRASVRRQPDGSSRGSSTDVVHASLNVADSVDSEPGDWPNVWPNAAGSHIARTFDCHGPSLCPVAACATGLAACQRAFELIRDGDCDVVLAGSADASLQPAILGSFQRLGVLARPVDDPVTACRPFDRDRSGFVVGEGAACLVFESLAHAKARGARWYAEWNSGRMLSDPSGLTQLDPSGVSLRRLLHDLLRDVDRVPDYINLHGTATIPNDRVESEAITAVLGSAARDVACSSLKGGLGHLLGAAGSVELAATVLAIRDQTVPPTVNLTAPEFPLDFTSRRFVQRQIEHAWKLSLGFGGHLSAACVSRLPGEGDRTRSV